MKIFLRERRGGLFLLFLASLIITATSLGQKVQSNEQTSLSVESQAENDSEIVVDDLGEVVGMVSSTAEGEAIEEFPSEEENFSNENETKKREEARLVAEALARAEADKYSELKEKLKKYCDKKYDSKKCKKYLSEVKILSKTNKEYKKLYDKYLEKREDREDDDDDAKSTEISPEEKALTLDFFVKSPSSEKQFEIQFVEGETVYTVMRRAKEQGKISYEKNTDETYGVYINTINGIKEGSEDDWTQNKYWILYVNGKSSSLGCSSHKLDKSDTSIEWRYEKYSF